MIRDQVPTIYPVILFPLFPTNVRKPIFSNNSAVFYKVNTTSVSANTVKNSRAVSRRC